MRPVFANISFILTGLVASHKLFSNFEHFIDKLLEFSKYILFIYKLFRRMFIFFQVLEANMLVSPTIEYHMFDRFRSFAADWASIIFF